jgi:hypothetical protein
VSVTMGEEAVSTAEAESTANAFGVAQWLPIRDVDLHQVGARCFEDVPIYLRALDDPKPALFSRVYEPNSGFLILSSEVTVRGRRGNTQGPSAILVQSDSATDTLKSTEIYRKNFLDFLSFVQGKLSKDQKALEALQDIKLKFDQEFKDTETLRATYSSANRGLWIEARAQAVKDWTGIWYKSGGLVDAVVRIYQVYVGNPTYLDAVVDKHVAEVEAVAKRAISGNPSKTLALAAAADTYVRADKNIRKNDNYGRDRIMNIGTGRGSSLGALGVADAMRSLVKFDLSGLSPTVEEARLELTIHSFGGSIDSPYRVGVYQITQPWKEGNGAEGHLDLIPDATNPDAASGVAWEATDVNNQAQPAFNATPISEITIDPKMAKPGSVINWDITSLVAEWVAKPVTNHGLMLRDVTTGGAFRELRFGTHEADMITFPDGVRGPRLVVRYR